MYYSKADVRHFENVYQPNIKICTCAVILEDDENEALLKKVQSVLQKLQTRFMEQADDRHVQEWLEKLEALLRKSNEMPKTIIAVAGTVLAYINTNLHVHVQYMHVQLA